MARGGFRKIEKSLESDAMNEQLHTRLEETRTWDEHEMACGSESEPILLLIAREWKKSRELETFSSLREQLLSSPCSIYFPPVPFSNGIFTIIVRVEKIWILSKLF